MTVNNQERILVTYKPKGTTVSIMRKQFDGQVHELIEEKVVEDPVVEEKPKKKAPAKKTTTKKEDGTD